MKAVRAPISLPRALVPSADAIDGLLKTADLNTPIAVSVELWDTAEPQYCAQLVLNGELVGPVRTITKDDKPGDNLAFELSESLFSREGIYTLSYRASNPFSDLHVFSDSIELKVDRTPPGAAILSPIVFPDVSLGNYLTGQIPGYGGMQEGDFIQTVCNGVKGPLHKVVEEELSYHPISIVFEGEFLQSLGSSSVLIEYFVTGRAGNVSVMSLPVIVTLQA